ncbi:hypothetical protein XENOCAPTIV_013696 [Xenoophorus captivus]|uniref:BRCT domain-containing protein n=1 Tax=Xenoophorus captivus TaxID=1517983 RepID=A0ABV0QKI6_9TELE
MEASGAGGRIGLIITHNCLFILGCRVVDESGERVLARLGGAMAKGVSDMNSGSFLSPYAFVVKDPEQEKKFSFSLQESLRTASSQPLLQGYEIHVTNSQGASRAQSCSCCLMPLFHLTPLLSPDSVFQPRTVVISCEEDLRLCGPAMSASLLIVTAEFILTGILQQRVDFETHALPPPVTNLQPAAGREGGRKKT